jgi:hypothetical protein
LIVDVVVVVDGGGILVDIVDLIVMNRQHSGCPYRLKERPHIFDSSLPLEKLLA